MAAAVPHTPGAPTGSAEGGKEGGKPRQEPRFVPPPEELRSLWEGEKPHRQECPAAPQGASDPHMHKTGEECGFLGFYSRSSSAVGIPAQPPHLRNLATPN